MKVTNSTGITVRDSDVSRNDGPGIWTDLSVKYVSLVRNLTEKNGRSGIEIELSSSVNAVGNVSVGNGEAGIWVLESQDVQVFHNALYGNRPEIWVEEGPRAEVHNVWIRNNILGLGRDGSPALFNVDDWTEERSADRRLTGQDTHSIWSRAVTNPYVRYAASGDYRAPVGAPIGAPVKAAMAWQVGVPSGTQLPIGPVAPVIDH